jgi:hypothetical protein
MKRALVLVEGQTEERFVKDVLFPHFWPLGLGLSATVLTTKRAKSGAVFKGGVTSFGRFENDARRLLGSAGGALVTTMLDYYRLPADFPGMADRPAAMPLVRVRHVEAAIKVHLGGRDDFWPYLSLHEFEALLFSSPGELPRAVGSPAGGRELTAIRTSVPTPEDINERPGCGPSDRIATILPSFRKRLHGPTVAQRIGLPRLREECPHFNEWITLLETHARSV